MSLLLNKNHQNPTIFSEINFVEFSINLTMRNVKKIVKSL